MLAQGLAPQTEDAYRQYLSDPESYARDILGVQWWSKQAAVARALLTHQRVMVRASHTVGKTHFGGGITNWWYDTADPSIALTTAPTNAQVKDLLWKEVRAQRRGRPGLMPRAPRMESSESHYAAGYTANDADAFQGRHEERLLILFDEAVGIDAEFWEAADAMLSSGPDNRFLAFYNPTDTASTAYDYELSGDAEVIVISALDHPNIAAQLVGQPKPFPKAIDLEWVEERIKGDRPWCTPIQAQDATANDIEWPPGSGDWYRPGPLFESRVLGRWPSQAVGSVWSETAFRQAESANLAEPLDTPCELGCDVARFGDDNTEIHVRRGPVSLHHEAHNGWGTDQTAGRLKELARQFGQHCGIDGAEVPVKIDDDGVGGGVWDQRDGFNFLRVSAGSNAVDTEGYPNRRSELWFVVAERALYGMLDLSRLPESTRRELRRQCMTPTWKVNAQGQRVVEPKDQTKKRLKRSPDGADAMNLAYAFVPPPESAYVETNVSSTYGSRRRR